MGEYRRAVVRAFPYTIPVLAGYLFIGAAFGVMFADQGYNVLWAILMSVVVYAGSGQYLATNFFVPGMSILQAVFLTVMVNIRHVFYGLSLVDRYNRFGRKRWYLIFGMTDETYSLICTTGVPDDVDEEKFLLSITLLNQLYWIVGTAIGGAFGVALLFAETQLHMQQLFLPLYILVCSLLIVPIIVTTLAIHKPTVTGFSCIVFLSISIYHVGDVSPYTYAINRLLDTVIGIVVALAVNLLLPGSAPIAAAEQKK